MAGTVDGPRRVDASATAGVGRAGVPYGWIACLDLLVLLSCATVGVAAQPLATLPAPVFDDQPLLQPALFTALTMLAMLALGLYERRSRDRFADVAMRVAAALFLSALAMPLLWYVLPLHPLAGGQVTLSLALGFAATLGNRSVLGRVIETRARRRRILVLGSGPAAATIREKMRRASDWRGLTLVGFLLQPGAPVAAGLAPRLNSNQGLPGAVRDLSVDEVVVALERGDAAVPSAELAACREQGVPVTDLATFFEREAGKLLPELVVPDFFARHPAFRPEQRHPLVTRSFDVAVSLALLTVTWPLMCLAMLAIKAEDGRAAPLFYRQARVGQGGRVFKVLKLRSMMVDAERDGRPRWARIADPRITRVGAVLRRTRIDELPQLINVLAGDMAFVGPRPERPEIVRELARQIPYFALRHCVKPGVTGWAQTHYPYGASVRDAANKLEYDLYYVKHRSLLLDALITLRTVEVVLLARGAR